MLGLKRQSYGRGCAERPTSKLLKDDLQSIYESTLHKLFAGASSDSHHPDTPNHASSCLAASSPDGKGDLSGANAPISSSASSSTDLRNNTILRGENTCSCQKNSDFDCFHCRRKICRHCSRHCDCCQQLFCTLCSLLNFNERYDTAFCLDCSRLVEKKDILKREVRMHLS
eukprot:c1094_g1_i1 orf=308-820(+)